MADYLDILKDLKSKKYAKVYFLHGNEPYFIDKITDYVEKNVLSEAERGFNQTVLYGKDSEFKTVLDTVSRFPMMSEKQVVILKEAQQMRDFAKLEPYLKNPLDATIFVISYKHKKLDMRTAIGKLLKKHALVLESKKLYDNQIPDWIVKEIKSRKLKINHQSASLIADYLGSDLSKIENELDKLSLNIPSGTEITNDIIEKHIGISKDYNTFELQRAIAENDVLKAIRIINYFIANPKSNPIQMMIGTLYSFFSKLYMYQFVRRKSEKEILSAMNAKNNWYLKDYKTAIRHFNLSRTERAIQILKETDLRSKGVDYNNTGTPYGDLLKEMIWKIMH